MTRTERTYYVVFGGYSFAALLLAPVYPLFLLSRGLDLFQMSVIGAVYLATAFAFEVPTGAIADVFGRKVSFVLACVLRGVAYALYATARDFTDCLVAEVVDGIGTTLASGALEAWVVDGVRAEGDRRPTDALFARGLVIVRTATIGGAILCGYLAEVSWTLPWLLSAAVFAVTAVVAAVAMGETPRPAAAVVRRPGAVLHSARAALHEVAASPFLLLVCLVFFVTAFAGYPLHLLWQRHLEEIDGTRLAHIGWITAFLNLAGLAGSALLPRALRAFRRERLLLAAALWRAATVGVLAAATSVRPALTGLLLQEISQGLGDPIYAAWTNEHVSPAQRATVLSIRATSFTLGGAAGLVCLGLMARDLGIAVALGGAAVVFALAAPVFPLLGRLGRRTARAARRGSVSAPRPSAVR